MGPNKVRASIPVTVMAPWRHDRRHYNKKPPKRAAGAVIYKAYALTSNSDLLDTLIISTFNLRIGKRLDVI